MDKTLPFFCITDVFKEQELFIEQFGRHKNIKAGTILYAATEEPLLSFYIKNGLAKLDLVNEYGDDTTMYYLGPKTIYPTNPYDIQHADERSFFFTAVTDMEVISFPNSKIFDMMKANYDFSICVYQMMGKVINAMCSMRLLDTYRNSEIKVCSYIYLCHVTAPFLSLTQEQIGKNVGLSRREISKVLSKLRKDSIIETKRNKIEILDENELLKHCSDVCRTHRL